MPNDDPTPTANRAGHVCSTAELGVTARPCEFCGGPVDDSGGYTKDFAGDWYLSCSRCCAESGGAVREISSDGKPGINRY